MSKPFKGTINVDIRDSEPDWSPFEPPKAPDGAPSVLYIVLDDVGFSAMSCYGGPIETPNIDRIVASGVRFTQFHTAALCSPTRSCLLEAVVDIPAPGAEGVLFGMGSRFGGHALYVKDNRLHYVNNFVGMAEQKIDGTQDVPTGENMILSASFDKDGEDPPHVSTGILSLYHGDKKVAEGRIKTQPGMFMIA